MEPRIQYARTSDGVDIAFWTMGEGRPFVHLPWFPFSHIELELQIMECRRWYESLAANRMLVRYDGRGAGLSQRAVTDRSLGARMLDLSGVVERLNLADFALFGFGHSGMVALAYAVRYPRRVSHVVASHSYASASDFAKSPQIRAMGAMIAEDWELFTETTAHALLGWAEGEPSRRFAELMRESVTLEETLAAFQAFRDVDIADILEDVKSPALIIQRREVPWLSVDSATKLASRIPNAQLVLLEGGSSAPWLGDVDAELRVIDRFLGMPVPEAVVHARPSFPHGTAAAPVAVILFADIADSTALTERMGDAAFRAKARSLDGALRTVIREHAGTPIEGKLLGDGVLAVFTSARQAIEAALACGQAGSGAGLPLHLGLHAGDVIREEGNVYGGAVNIASRISGLSAPGEVLVSDTVRSLARTSAGVEFDDTGERELKGVSDRVRVWAVRQEKCQ